MVIFQFHHHIKPEFIETYKAAVLEDARLSIQEEGILRFEVLQDSQDPTHFSLLEVYRDVAAREYHMQTPYLLKFRETVLGMFAQKGQVDEFCLFFPGEIRK